MADNPPTPQSENPEGEEQENLQAEPEQEEKKRRQAFSEEVPETHQIGLTAQLLAGLSLLRYQRFNIRRNAIAVVTDPNLAENLLDLTHPEKCIATRAALRITREELVQKKAIENGFAQARFLFWKSPALTQDRHDRVVLATSLAEKLHTSVNNQETVIKVQNYIDRYHLLPEEGLAFKTQFRDWRKKNPRADIDNFLVVETRNICRHRGEKFDQKEERKRLEGQRQQAIDEHKEIIEATAKVIKNDVLNPDKPRLTQDRYQLEILNEASASTVLIQAHPASSPIIAPVQIPTAAPAVTSPSNFQTAPQLAQPVGRPVRIIPPPGEGVRMPQIRIHLPAGVSNFFGGVGNKLGSLFGGVGRRLGGAFNKANLAMNAAKTALNTGLNALAPGLGAAADKINSVLMAITGVDVEGLVVKLVIVVVIGIPVALMFLPLLLNSSSALPYYGSENAREVALSDNNSLSWSGFEEKFLATSKLKTNDQKLKAVSWQEFEKENLTPFNLDKYLSLEKK